MAVVEVRKLSCGVAVGGEREGSEYLVSGQWEYTGVRVGQGYIGVYLGVIWTNSVGLDPGLCVLIGGVDCMIVDKSSGGTM